MAAPRPPTMKLSSRDQSRVEQVRTQKVEIPTDRQTTRRNGEEDQLSELDQTPRSSLSPRSSPRVPQQARRFSSNSQASGNSSASDEQYTAEELAVAEWSLACDGISPKAVGDFLGGPSELQASVRKQYTARLKLGGRPFVDALRFFLTSFELPGEAQQVDRIIQSFADAWICGGEGGPGDDADADADADANASWQRFVVVTPRPPSLQAQRAVVTSAETAYALAFALLVLGADLHRCFLHQPHGLRFWAKAAVDPAPAPDPKHEPDLSSPRLEPKMTCEQFTANSRGVGTDGGDLPRALLESFYDAVTRQAIALPVEPGQRARLHTVRPTACTVGNWRRPMTGYQ